MDSATRASYLAAFEFAELSRRSANCSAFEEVEASASASACRSASHAAGGLAACTEEVRTYFQQSSAGDPALSFLRCCSTGFSN